MTQQLASPLFYTVRNRQLAKRLAEQQSSRFEGKKVERTGTVLTVNSINVSGQRYEFINSTNPQATPGTQLDVWNVQRPAAAIYAPRDTSALVVLSGGGESAPAVVITDVTEGPGIDVVNRGQVRQVGLGGDSILLYHLDGSPVSEYTISAYGTRSAAFDAALTAAVTGERIDTLAGDLAGDHTIPAGVFVTGPATTFTGTITNNGVLLYCRIGGTFINNGTALVVDPVNGYIGVNGKPTEQLEVFGDTTVLARGPLQITGVGSEVAVGTGFSVNAENFEGGRTWSFLSTGAAAGWPPGELGAGCLAIFDTSAAQYALIVLPNRHVLIGPDAYYDLAQFAVLAQANVVGQVVRGAYGQTANLQEWQSLAGAVLAAITANGAVDLKEQAAPATPAAGYGRLYAGTDDRPHWVEDTGINHDLTAVLEPLCCGGEFLFCVDCLTIGVTI